MLNATCEETIFPEPVIANVTLYSALEENSLLQVGLEQLGDTVESDRAFSYGLPEPITFSVSDALPKRLSARFDVAHTPLTENAEFVADSYQEFFSLTMCA